MKRSVVYEMCVRLVLNRSFLIKYHKRRRRSMRNSTNKLMSIVHNKIYINLKICYHIIENNIVTTN